MKYPSKPVLGYKVYSDPLLNISLSGKRVVINTINAYSYVMAKRDPEFKEALRDSDILLPDGLPIVWASKITGKGGISNKIAGYDIFCYLMKLLEAKGGSCFFLGASEVTLNKITERINKEYPHVRVGTYSPPYKKEFSEEENRLMKQAVNQFVPDVLFVGMTAPKQEKWVQNNSRELDAGIICAIGAVFDFYAGTVKRPGNIWIKVGLEWFIRLIKEPKRLWKRYLVYSPLFFIDMFLCALHIKKFE
jgi:N-acetylglucosaminyldiphosphoundecaprenol N-acetyl-beta-D-mannosaminyltransferase